MQTTENRTDSGSALNALLYYYERKTLHNSTVSGARGDVADLSVVGNGDMFRLMCKASSQDEGWMKKHKSDGNTRRLCCPSYNANQPIDKHGDMNNEKT